MLENNGFTKPESPATNLSYFEKNVFTLLRFCRGALVKGNNCYFLCKGF